MTNNIYSTQIFSIVHIHPFNYTEWINTYLYSKCKIMSQLDPRCAETKNHRNTHGNLSHNLMKLKMAEIKNHRNTHGNLSRNLIKLKMAEIKNHRNTHGNLSRKLMKLKMVFTFLVRKKYWSGKSSYIQSHI